jgi:hypothetical protein
MALPTSYLTSTKNLEGILNAMKTAKAPEKFSQAFLESLEFKSSSDRLIIGVLKALGLIDAQGAPTDRYYKFLDQTQSAKVLAQGIEEAYGDLFQVNTKANELSSDDVKNKLRTLTQGKVGDAVLDKMSLTFRALCDLADFSSPPAPISNPANPVETPSGTANPLLDKHPKHAALSLGGLVYNIQILLPESRDHAVYDALFRSLREHLLQ